MIAKCLKVASFDQSFWVLMEVVDLLAVLTILKKKKFQYFSGKKKSFLMKKLTAFHAFWL